MTYFAGKCDFPSMVRPLALVATLVLVIFKVKKYINTFKRSNCADQEGGDVASRSKDLSVSSSEQSRDSG